MVKVASSSVAILPSIHVCSLPYGTTEGAKGAAIGTIALALTRIAIVELPWRHTTSITIVKRVGESYTAHVCEFRITDFGSGSDI
jgi:hypothetical protein